MSRPHPSCRASVLTALLVACGSPPAPVESSQPPPSVAPSVSPPVAPRGPRADVPDDCTQQPGQPAPAPLRTAYTGVAAAARCDREVYTIMGGVTHFLGVECRYCHTEPDYAADTHNKQVANWMARELVPVLRARSANGREGGGVWCKDCHAGKAKFLGNPRRRDLAIDWMLTHLTEDFVNRERDPLTCKGCHQGDLGSPQFQPKLILSELSGLPRPPAAAAASAPQGAAPAAAGSSEVAPMPPSSAPAAPDPPAPLTPIPDFGAR